MASRIGVCELDVRLRRTGAGREPPAQRGVRAGPECGPRASVCPDRTDGQGQTPSLPPPAPRDFQATPTGAWRGPLEPSVWEEGSQFQNTS